MTNCLALTTAKKNTQTHSIEIHRELSRGSLRAKRFPLKDFPPRCLLQRKTRSDQTQMDKKVRTQEPLAPVPIRPYQGQLMVHMSPISAV